MQRVIQIATKPGDIVLDCFLGSGTTAAVAHKMGRRWVGIERSAETVANVRSATPTKSWPARTQEAPQARRAGAEAVAFACWMSRRPCLR